MCNIKLIYVIFTGYVILNLGNLVKIMNLVIQDYWDWESLIGAFRFGIVIASL